MSIQINREAFLNDLLMVKGGLSNREFTEQSSCFVFQGGYVMTFNDEVACRRKTSSGSLEGAVTADRLLDILQRMPDPELTILSVDGKLIFKGKRKGFSVTKEKEIILPIDQVEKPGIWKPLPARFTENLARVMECVSRDETKFLLTCVHFTSEFMEASDNRQIMRHIIPMPIKKPVLVRAKALGEVKSLDMDDISVTPSWVHFRKGREEENSLIYSCRKYADKFPDLRSVLQFEGQKITLPKGLGETSERAGIFADDGSSGDPWVKVSLSANKLRIKGEGAGGSYWEVKKTKYTGPEIEFIIGPTLLKKIADEYTSARISENLLKVTGGVDIDKGGKWEYIARLGKLGTDKEEEGGEEE